MDLMYQIASLPVWLAGLIIVIIPTLITMAGPIIVRRMVGVERIVGNNEVAGFKFATLGVIYAVLLGLVVVSVWEKYSEGEDAVTRESSALASFYRVAGGLEPEAQQALREAISRYAESAIRDDWPAMTERGQSAKSRDALDATYTVVLALGVDTGRDAVLFDTLLTQLDLVTDARRERLALATGVVPMLIWLVLFIGAALTLGFTFFFGLENLRAQVMMAGMLALVIFLALFVTISISHPFAGPINVTPEPIALVLEDFRSPD
jgi:Protein of unknown function (DUF4239)